MISLLLLIFLQSIYVTDLILIFVSKRTLSHTVNCVLFNAQSLGNKMYELHNLLYLHCHDIILITETWMDCTFTDGLIDPESKYYVVRRDRNRSGGRVCAVISRQLIFSEVCLDYSNSSLELLCFDIVQDYGPMCVRIFLCYRPLVVHTPVLNIWRN